MIATAAAPALELAHVYASRWEHELYFRELKQQLRRTALLQSHTAETGAQEIAALMLASAVLATERARAATGAITPFRIGIGRTTVDSSTLMTRRLRISEKHWA